MAIDRFIFSLKQVNEGAVNVELLCIFKHDWGPPCAAGGSRAGLLPGCCLGAADDRREHVREELWETREGSHSAKMTGLALAQTYSTTKSRP